jgi:hypothetical protein
MRVPRIQSRSTAALSSAWLGVAAGLYAGLVALELYWNLIDWRPRPDFVGMGLVAWILGILCVVRYLVRRDAGSWSRFFSLALCVGLSALGAYLLPAEPLTEGFLGRATSSPWWYRGGRLAALCAPLAFWIIGWRHTATVRRA